MNHLDIRDYIVAAHKNVEAVDASGGIFLFNDPAKNFPFVTITTGDEYDKFSDLNREGVFRVNIGLSKETFKSLFSESSDHDFKALDQLMPHPVYGQMYWICVLNPSGATFDRIKPLIAEAYEVSAKRYVK